MGETHYFTANQLGHEEIFIIWFDGDFWNCPACGKENGKNGAIGICKCAHCGQQVVEIDYKPLC